MDTITNVPRTFADVIELWETAEAFGAEVGVTGLVARTWKRRNNIPARHWTAVVAAARHRGHAQVTLHVLARLAAKPVGGEAA